jgi:hypothetical protein
MKKTHFYYMVLSISLIISLISCTSGKKEIEIGLNQNIHHDDFEYAVTNFSTAKLLTSGSDTLRANGIFYIVHFRVMNLAKRSNHQWDNSIGYIVDENGSLYENNTYNQVFLDKSFPFGWKEMYNTPHGQTDTTILVFDLPLNITKPYLMVIGDILMGDIFDAGRFRRVKIKLF